MSHAFLREKFGKSGRQLGHPFDDQLDQLHREFNLLAVLSEFGFQAKHGGIDAEVEALGSGVLPGCRHAPHGGGSCPRVLEHTV